MSNKRVACYARTSIIDQATGLESQVRVLRQYCEQNGFTDTEFFTDGGISGTKASRPALDQMMAAVAAWRDFVSRRSLFLTLCPEYHAFVKCADSLQGKGIALKC